jgi:hypothetical protein
MPDWTPREEREYDHIKRFYLARGASKDSAEEIAARTVNKTREKGDTLHRRTIGTGNPRGRFDERTRDELMNLAREADIPGRSGMRKAELADALRRKRSQ